MRQDLMPVSEASPWLYLTISARVSFQVLYKVLSSGVLYNYESQASIIQPEIKHLHVRIKKFINRLCLKPPIILANKYDAH